MKVLLALLLLASAIVLPTKPSTEPGKVVYQTAELTVTQVSPNAFVHTSFMDTKSFGRVACNGMVVRSQGETVVFDTPADEKASRELIGWINSGLHCKVNAVVPTHFHEDCVGGLPEFARQRIPSYANQLTLELAKARKFNVPQHGFTRSLTLKVGKTQVQAVFYGEGHTRDNVVGYFAAEQVLFGGCLIKELEAGKGNLADANVAAWPATVEKVKQAYPAVRVVIPGHGQSGDASLLDYTIRLFQSAK